MHWNWHNFFIMYSIGAVLILALGVHHTRTKQSINLKDLSLMILVSLGWPIMLIPYLIWFIVNQGDEVTVAHSYQESRKRKAAKRGFDN